MMCCQHRAALISPLVNKGQAQGSVSRRATGVRPMVRAGGYLRSHPITWILIF